MLITTVPKSGSKLLKRILFQAGVDVSRMAHTPYRPDAIAPDGRALCLIRDPRDLVVSLAAYADRAGANVQAMARVARSQRELQNIVYFGKVTNQLSAFDGWVSDPRCLTVRFEELVGPDRGGAADVQMATADRLADWLDVDRDRMRAAMEAGIDTSTYRRGVAGAWRDEMAPELAEIIGELSGEVMRAWGYR